jgi:hypothetical protein
MSLSSPEIAAHRALIAYLSSEITSLTGLENARVIEAFPEPSEDLHLDFDAPTIAVELGDVSNQWHQHVWHSGTTTIQRYYCGYKEAPVTIGVWAPSVGIRDDLDRILLALLNRPYWTTVEAAVSTTIPASIPNGESWVTPVSMDGILPNTSLAIGDELVMVKSTKRDRFYAAFKKAHAAGETCVEYKRIRSHIEHSIHLRCTDHFDVIARFDFGDAKNKHAPGQTQRQEWHSIREGTVWVPYVVEVAGASQEAVTTTGTYTGD